MCTLSTRSILRQRDPTSLEEFELGSVIKDDMHQTPCHCYEVSCRAHTIKSKSLENKGPYKIKSY